MVEYYPGPWQDGPLTTEVHDIGAGTVTRTADADVAQPVASGWSVAGWKTWQASGSASRTYPGGMEDPPSPDIAVSQGAWAAAHSAPVSDAVGGVATAEISHPRMQMANDTFGTWHHQETWSAVGGYWKFRYRRPTNDLQAGVAPPFAEWPEGAVGIGFDYPPPGNVSQYWIDLIGVEVRGSENGRWPLYIKAPNDAGAWFGDADMNPDDAIPNASLTESARLEVAGALTLDVAPFEQFVVENAESGEASQYDPRWLSGSVIPRDLWPGIYGDVEWSDSWGPSGCGQIVVTYRPPRWRYVYDRPIVEPAIPYRRVYPRHDSLAGGPGRNYPPSKALQTSNRIGGGHL